VATPPAATTAASPHEAIAPRTNNVYPHDHQPRRRGPSWPARAVPSTRGRDILAPPPGNGPVDLRGSLETARGVRAGDGDECVDDGRVEVRPGAAVELGDSRL